jgi:superfamily II DNA or RNA helicase
MTALRPYQVDVIQRIDAEIEAGGRRVLLVAPTGAGKTVIAADIIDKTVQAGGRVIFVAHRRELIVQASTKLHAVGIDHGIVQAGFPTRPAARVQVASIQTLHARAVRSTRLELPQADLVVLDEAHHARARTYREIVQAYPDAVLLGMTATPCRSDGRGLGNVFDVIVECPPVAELIAGGWLVPTKVYAPTRPDLKGVKVARGDYVESELAARMDQHQFVGDVVAHWLSLAGRRRTVVFATGVAHSVHIRDQFRAAGVWAEHVDGSTPIAERDVVLAKLASGPVELVCNAMVLTEGWDSPEVACLVLARPTKSVALYRQMVGRVLRPAPGKDHALILDHAGAVFQHGFVDEPIAWSLREDRRAENRTQTARSEHRAPALSTCPECHAVRIGGNACSSCGWRPQPKAAPVDRPLPSTSPTASSARSTATVAGPGRKTTAPTRS